MASEIIEEIQRKLVTLNHSVYDFKLSTLKCTFELCYFVKSIGLKYTLSCNKKSEEEQIIVEVENSLGYVQIKIDPIGHFSCRIQYLLNQDCEYFDTSSLELTKMAIFTFFKTDELVLKINEDSIYRIESFRKLKAGWYEGVGKAISNKSINLALRINEKASQYKLHTFTYPNNDAGIDILVSNIFLILTVKIEIISKKLTIYCDFEDNLSREITKLENVSTDTIFKIIEDLFTEFKIDYFKNKYNFV